MRVFLLGLVVIIGGAIWMNIDKDFALAGCPQIQCPPGTHLSPECCNRGSCDNVVWPEVCVECGCASDASACNPPVCHDWWEEGTMNNCHLCCKCAPDTPPPCPQPCGNCIPCGCGILVSQSEKSNKTLAVFGSGESPKEIIREIYSGKITLSIHQNVNRNHNFFLASLQFVGNLFKNFLNWINSWILSMKSKGTALFFE